MYSKSCMSAHVPAMRAFRVRRAKRTWRTSPTARPETVQDICLSSGSTMFESREELSVAILSVRAKSTARICPLVPTISTENIRASP